VPVVLLGDQDAACASTRATVCPVPGHPCLSDVSADDVLEAVHAIGGTPEATVPGDDQLEAVP
jgi:hypothetical protein